MTAQWESESGGSKLGHVVIDQFDCYEGKLPEVNDLEDMGPTGFCKGSLEKEKNFQSLIKKKKKMSDIKFLEGEYIIFVWRGSSQFFMGRDNLFEEWKNNV